ncbi:MAG: hypothetical protein PHY70_04475 [Methanocellales archaeon]|nr:hypothetical protein [Methanocellales archaeon]
MFTNKLESLRVLYFIFGALVALHWALMCSLSKETSLTISFFTSVIFIPILLILCQKQKFEEYKSWFYALTLSYPSVSYKSIMQYYFDLPSQDYAFNLVLIIIFSFVITFFIWLLSDNLIGFLGLVIDEKILANIRAYKIPNNFEDGVSFIKATLLHFSDFEHLEKVSDNILIYRDSITTLGRNYMCIFNKSESTFNFLGFNIGMDGIQPFDAEEIKGYDLIAKHMLNVTPIDVSDNIKREYENFFYRFESKLKKLSFEFKKRELFEKKKTKRICS